MPTKETHELQKGLLAEFLSEQPEPVPMGVVWPGLETVNLETEDDHSKYSDISLNPPELTLTFTIRSKRNRKTFKKYLMSWGLSRDTAELACVLVACHKGGLSYNDFFNYIFKDFPGAVIKTR